MNLGGCDLLFAPAGGGGGPVGCSEFVVDVLQVFADSPLADAHSVGDASVGGAGGGHGEHLCFAAGDPPGGRSVDAVGHHMDRLVPGVAERERLHEWATNEDVQGRHLVVVDVPGVTVQGGEDYHVSVTTEVRGRRVAGGDDVIAVAVDGGPDVRLPERPDGDHVAQ